MPLTSVLAAAVLFQRSVAHPSLPRTKASILVWQMPGRNDNGMMARGSILVTEAVWKDGTVVWFDPSLATGKYKKGEKFFRIGHIDPLLVKHELDHLAKAGYFKA